MPFKRIYRKPKGRRVYKRRGAAKPVTKKLIRRVIQSTEETKIKTIPTAPTNLLQATLYAASPPHSILRGTASSERVGSQIYLKHITMLLRLYCLPSAWDCHYRVTVVELDDQSPIWNPPGNNSVFLPNLLSFTDVFHSNGIGASGLGPETYCTQGFINYTNVKRVLYDRKINIRRPSTSTTFHLVKPFKVHVKLDKMVKYAFEDARHLAGRNIFFLIQSYIPGAASGAISGVMDAEFMVTYKDA